MPDDVQIPAGAVGGDEISKPTETLLCKLNLLPPTDKLKEASTASAAFTGPPESVALIEAGATAASKWWAAGLGGAVAATWTAVISWWNSADPEIQRSVLWAAAIVTAASVIGIAYLLGSDIRGRAAVAAETVRARASLAEAFVRMAEQAHFRSVPTGDPRSEPGTNVDRLVGVPQLPVEKAATNEQGWHLIALLSNGSDRTRYLIAKGSAHEWVDADTVRFP